MPPDHQPDEVERRQAAVDIAVLKEQVNHLREGQEAMQAAIAGLSTKIDAMASQMAEAKGGWKLLLAVGGAAGTLTEIGHQVASHFTYKG